MTFYCILLFLCNISLNMILLSIWTTLLFLNAKNSSKFLFWFIGSLKPFFYFFFLFLYASYSKFILSHSLNIYHIFERLFAIDITAAIFRVTESRNALAESRNALVQSLLHPRKYRFVLPFLYSYLYSSECLVSSVSFLKKTFFNSFPVKYRYLYSMCFPIVAKQSAGGAAGYCQWKCFFGIWLACILLEVLS